MFVHAYYAFSALKPKLSTTVYETGGLIDRRVKDAAYSLQ